MLGRLEHINITGPRKTDAAGRELLDSYVLPKVAMVLVLISSGAGTWLALRGFNGLRPDLVVVKWLYFTAISTVLGGSIWAAFYAKPQLAGHADGTTPRFLKLEFERFIRIQKLAVTVALLSGVYALGGYIWLFGGHVAPWYDWLTMGQASLWLALVAITAHINFKPRTSDWPEQARPWLKLTVALALVSLVGTAVVDVFPYDGMELLPIVSRWIHLTAFGVWLGGAVWNVFVAGPAAWRAHAFEAMYASARQLDIFYKSIIVTLPLVLLTGLYQSSRLIDFGLSTLLGLPIGAIVFLKLCLLASLLAVSVACMIGEARSANTTVFATAEIDPARKDAAHRPAA